MAHQWINDHWNNVASAGHHYFYGWDSNHPQTVVVYGSQVTSEKTYSIFTIHGILGSTRVYGAYGKHNIYVGCIYI